MEILHFKDFRCRHKHSLGDTLVIEILLAPPAERQRSFSNDDLSIVVNFSIKSLISQKLSDNFFSFLACRFLWMGPMHSKNMDLV